MRKPFILVLGSVALLLLLSCSPRDFLTRRLAADLIAGSEAFRVPQQFQLRTGVVSNNDYLSPEYLMLQHRGWISATKVACPHLWPRRLAGNSLSHRQAWTRFKVSSRPAIPRSNPLAFLPQAENWWPSPASPSRATLPTSNLLGDGFPSTRLARRFIMPTSVIGLLQAFAVTTMAGAWCEAILFTVSLSTKRSRTRNLRNRRSLRSNWNERRTLTPSQLGR